MSATAHVADLKKIIADATEALKAIQMASAKTEKAAPTPLDASKTTACARASNQLTSTHTTPTAADDDDEWVWTPWDERIDGPSFLTSRHSLSPADAVTAHKDLSWCNPLACANSAPAKGNASDTGHSDTLDVRSGIGWLRTLCPERQERDSPPPQRCEDYGSNSSLESTFPRAHTLLKGSPDGDLRRQHELYHGGTIASATPDLAQQSNFHDTGGAAVEYLGCSGVSSDKLRERILDMCPISTACTLSPAPCTLSVCTLSGAAGTLPDLMRPPGYQFRVEHLGCCDGSTDNLREHTPCTLPSRIHVPYLPMYPISAHMYPCTLSRSASCTTKGMCARLRGSGRPPEPAPPELPTPELPLRPEVPPPSPDPPPPEPPPLEPPSQLPPSEPPPLPLSPEPPPPSRVARRLVLSSPSPLSNAVQRARSAATPISPVPMQPLSGPGSPEPEPGQAVVCGDPVIGVFVAKLLELASMLADRRAALARRANVELLPPPRYAPGTVWWGSEDCGCGHCPSSIERWWQHAEWCKQSLDHATAEAAWRKADESARSRGEGMQSILASAEWPRLLREERDRQEGSVEALKGILFAKYGDLREQPVGASEPEQSGSPSPQTPAVLPSPSPPEPPLQQHMQPPARPTQPSAIRQQTKVEEKRSAAIAQERAAQRGDSLAKPLPKPGPSGPVRMPRPVAGAPAGAAQAAREAQKKASITAMHHHEADLKEAEDRRVRHSVWQNDMRKFGIHITHREKLTGVGVDTPSVVTLGDPMPRLLPPVPSPLPLLDVATASALPSALSFVSSAAVCLATPTPVSAPTPAYQMDRSSPSGACFAPGDGQPSNGVACTVYSNSRATATGEGQGDPRI